MAIADAMRLYYMVSQALLNTTDRRMYVLVVGICASNIVRRMDWQWSRTMYKMLRDHTPNDGEYFAASVVICGRASDHLNDSLLILMSINRLTALLVPMRHKALWSSKRTWVRSAR